MFICVGVDISVGFGMIKKKYTFATEFGPIVQWIPACRQAGNGGGHKNKRWLT